MHFSFVTPRPGLREFVRDYLVAHFSFAPGDPVPLKCYAPKPEQGITFFVRGRPGIADPRTRDLRVAPPVAIFGQQTRRCDVQLAREFLMLRVHFQPGVLYRVMNLPLHELGEEYVDAEPVLGREVRDVSDRLDGARSYREMIDAIESYLAHRLARLRQEAGPVDRVTGVLMTDGAQASVDWLARQACLSPRQLHRKFTERVGVGPKFFSRLVRFHRAHGLKAAQSPLAWPAVALECGYTDYQHLVRDFREFTSTTPNVWLRLDRQSPEHRLDGGATT